jgi:hypothetical protein
MSGNASADDLRGVSDSQAVVRHVTRDHRSGTDYSIGADLDLGQDDGSGADHRSVCDTGQPAEHDSRADRHEPAEHDVVPDAGAAIDEDEFGELACRADHAARVHITAWSHAPRHGDDRRGIDQGSRAAEAVAECFRCGLLPVPWRKQGHDERVSLQGLGDG